MTHTKAAEKLKLCPFCGSTGEEVSVYHEVVESSDWFIRCHVCLVETAREESESLTIAKWNRRALPLPSAPEQAGGALTDADLTRIYKEANGETEGKSHPITTRAIFKAMRAVVSPAPEPAQCPNTESHVCLHAEPARAEQSDTPRVDALTKHWDDDGATRGPAYVAMRDLARELERAEQPQEAVAWIVDADEYNLAGERTRLCEIDYFQDDIDKLPIGTKLYAAPPAVAEPESRDLIIGIAPHMSEWRITFLPENRAEVVLLNAHPAKEGGGHE